MEIKIGADPEFFLRQHGELISAHGMVPGTKASPHKVEGGAIQVDGMALEFNINPATTSEEFVHNINTVLGSFRTFLPKSKGYEFDFSPVAEFGKELIAAQPEEARELGCDPDFNAYTGQANPRPSADNDFRTASGHIHIGWTSDEDINDPEHVEACKMVVRQLDYSLAEAMAWIDTDRKRQTLYGMLGTYRPKNYGVEYRVLSNKWVSDPKLMEFVFDVTKGNVEIMLEGDYYGNYQSGELQLNYKNGWANALDRSCLSADVMSKYNPRKVHGAYIRNLMRENNDVLFPLDTSKTETLSWDNLHKIVFNENIRFDEGLAFLQEDIQQGIVNG